MTVDTYFIISAKPIASSTPGIANARSCTIDPIAPCSSANNPGAHQTAIFDIRAGRNNKQGMEEEDAHASIISLMDPLGSISIAYRLSNPFTFVASLLNF